MFSIKQNTNEQNNKYWNSEIFLRWLQLSEFYQHN